jgi:hypothetical protein
MLALPFLPMDRGNGGKAGLFGKLEIGDFEHGKGRIRLHSLKQVYE